MAIAIDDTVGGENANSYISLLDAQKYFDGKFYNSTWLGLTEDQQRITLVEATRMIDALYNFNGTITNTDPRQALKWPRTGAYDCEGILVDTDTIPQEVKNAVCEQADYVAVTNAVSTTNNEYEKASVGKGAVDVTYKDGYTVQQIANPVLDFLRCLGDAISSATPNGISNNCVLRA